jgi:hypothetical protein
MNRAFVRSFKECGRLGLSRVQHGIAAMLLPDLGKVYTVLQKLATRGGEESAIRVFNLIPNTYTFGTAPLTNLIALYLRIVGGAKPS